MKKIVATSILFLACSAVFAQSKALKKANDLYAEAKFEQAIPLFEQVIADKQDIGQDTYNKLANSYFNTSQYAKARVHYAKLYEMRGSSLDESTFLRYIETVKAGRNYDTANRILREYYSDNPERLKLIADQKQQIDSIKAGKPQYTVKSIGINTGLADFGFARYTEDVVFFFSNADLDDDKKSKKKKKSNSTPIIYAAENNKTTAEFFNVRASLKNITPSAHNTSFTFSRNNRYIYFTTENENGKKEVNDTGVPNTRIMRGIVVGNEVIEVVPMDFNNVNYSYSYPALSADEKRLFFASDMPGGYGKTDIYYVELYEDGSTSEPKNAGKNVNTAAREIAPYIVGETLYFSSDGHFGIGGLDIFSSKITGTKKKIVFEMPVNLGAPINSNLDDYGFTQNSDEVSGYFSSNRSADDSKGKDDIYYYEKKIDRTQLFSGIVKDKNTRKPLSYALVQVFDGFDEELQSISTDKEGYYELILNTDSYYELVFSKEGYDTHYAEIETDNFIKKKVEQSDVLLVHLGKDIPEKKGMAKNPEAVAKEKANTIYYGVNQYQVSVTAQKELDKLLQYLQTNKRVKLKIEAHSDAKTETKDAILSINRAKWAFGYLVTKGLDPDRVIYSKGYTAKVPAVTCPEKNCTDAVYAKNRRTEFILIE